MGADEQNHNGKASGMGEEDGKEAMVKVSIEKQNVWIGPEDRGMQKKVWKGETPEK